MPTRTYHEFDTLTEARAYRQEHGTGGWIFVEQDHIGPAILFPPDMAPIDIFNHAMTRGMTGRLIGSQ